MMNLVLGHSPKQHASAHSLVVELYFFSQLVRCQFRYFADRLVVLAIEHIGDLSKTKRSLSG